jgi:predicted AlkP superfamily phosphohydrolase/phosphomutase
VNNKKVVILGFDGMDFDLTRTMMDAGKLPNFKRLEESGSFSPLLSVFPADSIPSWITTFTGLDPSDHGILDHVNYILGDQSEAKIDTSVFHRKTFWDRIGKEADAKVCVINAFMAYPVWPVNGVMVSGPVFVEGEIQVSDPEAVAGISLPESIGGLDDLPTRETMAPFLEKAIRDTNKEADFGLAMLEKNKPDLFFQTFLTSDRIQHFLWRYCDPTDPTHPGSTEVENGIDEFFAEADKILGRFMDAMSDDEILMVMSDHGHGMRCTHCFNFNEYFRQKGYLKSASGESKFNKKIIIEKMKNRVLKFLNDNDMEEYIGKIAKLVPNAKALKGGTHIANYNDSMCYAPDFAGSNPFGGVKINTENVTNYTEFRQQLIKELSAVEYEGEPLFKWLKPREEMYQGKHIDRYPDILYEMNPRVGTGFAMHTDLFMANPTHKKISGGHKKNGVLFLNNASTLSVVEKDCKISNIHSSILSIFDIHAEAKEAPPSFIETAAESG